MALTLQKRGAVVLAVLLLGVILAATLLPTSPPRVNYSPWCFTCGELATLDVVLNVLLFIPFGAALRVAGLAPWRAILVAGVVTLGIELLQFRVVTGRDSSISDLLANIAGGAIGVATASWRRELLSPPSARASALVLAAAIAWLAIVGGTALLLRPSHPTGWLHGQYVPMIAEIGGFDGRLLSGTIGGDTIPKLHIAPNSPAARALRADTIVLRAMLRSGSPTWTSVAIVGIGPKGIGRHIVLSQQGRSALFRLRLRSQDARLRAPGLRLASVFPDSGAPPARYHFAGGYADESLFLEARSDTSLSRLAIPLSVGLGWSFLMPTDVRLAGIPRLANALWMALLAFPLGYWTAFARTRRGRRTLLVAVPALLVGGLGLLPPLLGAHATTPTEWVGAAAGVALGWLGAMAMARKAPRHP